MTQYLFAVYMVEGEPVPSEEETQNAYRQVDEFNKEVMESGAWVFAGGLHPRPARPSCASRTETS
jgi:hypothetical protein